MCLAYPANRLARRAGTPYTRRTRASQVFVSMDHFASYDVCVSTAFMTSAATKLNSWYARPLVYHHLVPVWHLRRLLRQGSVFVGPRGGTRRRRCRVLYTGYMLFSTCYELHETARRGRSPLTDARLYSRIHYIRMHYWTLLLIQHSSNDFPPLRSRR